MIEATKLPPELRANFTTDDVLAMVSRSEAEIIRLRARVKDLEVALQQIVSRCDEDRFSQIGSTAARIARKALAGVA